jgi:hypothetical protein
VPMRIKQDLLGLQRMGAQQESPTVRTA